MCADSNGGGSSERECISHMTITIAIQHLQGKLAQTTTWSGRHNYDDGLESTCETYGVC